MNRPSSSSLDSPGSGSESALVNLPRSGPRA